MPGNAGDLPAWWVVCHIVYPGICNRRRKEDHGSVRNYQALSLVL